MLALRHPFFCSIAIEVEYPFRANVNRHSKSKGIKMVLLAQAQSLALLEVVVHLFWILVSFSLVVASSKTPSRLLVIQSAHRPPQPSPSILNRNFLVLCQSLWAEFLALWP